MKLYDIFKAYSSVEYIYKMYFPWNKSRAIMKLKDIIFKEANFYIDSEKKIALKYARTKGKELIIENGKISFENQEKMKKYLLEINELKNTEIDIVFEKLKIEEWEISDQNISAEYINNLNNFITFGGD